MQGGVRVSWVRDKHDKILADKLHQIKTRKTETFHRLPDSSQMLKLRTYAFNYQRQTLSKRRLAKNRKLADSLLQIRLQESPARQQVSPYSLTDQLKTRVREVIARDNLTLKERLKQIQPTLKAQHLLSSYRKSIQYKHQISKVRRPPFNL